MKILVARQDQGETEEPEEELGIRVSNLTEDVMQQFNIEDSQGVMVTDVASGKRG